MERCQEDFGKTRRGHVWGEISLKVYCEIGVVFFLISYRLTSNSFLELSPF